MEVDWKSTLQCALPISDNERMLLPLTPAFYDFDPAQIANNNAFIRWMELGRGEWLAATPWPLARCIAAGIAPVLRRTEIDYLRPLRLGEGIQLEVTPLFVGASKWTLGHRFLDAADNARIYAAGQQTGGFINLASGSPIRMPADLREALLAGTA